MVCICDQCSLFLEIDTISTVATWLVWLIVYSAVTYASFFVSQKLCSIATPNYVTINVVIIVESHWVDSLANNGYNHHDTVYVVLWTKFALSCFFHEALISLVWFSNCMNFHHSWIISVTFNTNAFDSVAPIQQFAWMPIFHNPYCLYADPIWYCLCEIYSCIYLVYNCSHMV